MNTFFLQNHRTPGKPCSHQHGCSSFQQTFPQNVRKADIPLTSQKTSSNFSVFVGIQNCTWLKKKQNRTSKGFQSLEQNMSIKLDYILDSDF